MKDQDNAQKQKKFLDEYTKTLDIKGSALAAGYKKQTAVVNALNFLNGKTGKLQLDALIEDKAAHYDVRKGFIVSKYLKILSWALSEDDYNKPNDPALALRALEGLARQLSGGFLAQDSGINTSKSAICAPITDENTSIVTAIKGLDPNKI